MAQYLDLTGLGTLVTNIKTQISNAIANKQDKATTLAGYGITDAKIDNGVITLGSNTITPLTSHQSLSDYSTLDNTIKGLSISGKTITYTLGNNNTGTLTTQDTTYSDATTSASGLMTADMVTKLSSIATNANDYSHPTGDGNLHVPANGTSNNGKFLMAGSTAGTLSWGIPTNTVTTATTTGDGNAVTAISATNGALTVTKGATFLTSHQDISGKANLNGATFTGNISVGGTVINVTNGHIVLASGLELY